MADMTLCISRHYADKARASYTEAAGFAHSDLSRRSGLGAPFFSVACLVAACAWARRTVLAVITGPSARLSARLFGHPGVHETVKLIAVFGGAQFVDVGGEVSFLLLKPLNRFGLVSVEGGIARP